MADLSAKKNVLYLKYYKQITSINRVNNKCLCVGVSTVPLSIFDFGIYPEKESKTGNEEINSLCWSWLQKAITRKVNGPLLKEQALKFASDLII
jgi:hypothetical protein